MRKILAGAFGALCLAFAAPLAAQDYIVTASPLAEPGPGRMAPADTVVSLAAGQVLELIGPAGPARIEGPYEGAIGAALGGGAQVAAASPLAELVRRRERMTALGASRSGDAETATETQLQLMADGAWCVPGPKPTLFLAAAKADRVVALIGEGGARAEIFWPAGASTAPWPDDAPFTAGARYRIAMNDIEMPGELALKPVPAAAAPAEALPALLAAGCLAQAEAAVAALAQGG